ncbi:MAG: hypothetical protein ACI965_001246 [Paraglaciecola sp.]|jgi:hypothetical protein
MQIKHFRIGLGSILILMGVVFFILPGSMFLLLLGLLTLSYDVPKAKDWLKVCQRSMSQSARKLDRVLLNRKLRSKV